MDFSIIITWLLGRGIKILLILIGAQLISRIGQRFIKKGVATLVEKSYKMKGIKDGKARERREATLAQVFISFFRFLVWIMAILTILPELGVNIGPLLAGIGVAGLALGMGTKNLIQDYIAGLFIIFEDQYRVGEEIEVAGKKGVVLDINLRRTVIKDAEGLIHFIPNGQIKVTSNFSRKKVMS